MVKAVAGRMVYGGGYLKTFGGARKGEVVKLRGEALAQKIRSETKAAEATERAEIIKKQAERLRIIGAPTLKAIGLSGVAAAFVPKVEEVPKPHRGYGEAFTAAESIEPDTIRRTPSLEPSGKPWWYFLTAQYKLDLIRAATERDKAKVDVQEQAQTPLTPPTPPMECKKGLFYDAAWYLPCAAGYVEYSLKGHNKCICSAKMSEAKAQLDALYASEDVSIIDDDKDKLGGYMPIAILGAVVFFAVSMLRK